MLTNLLEMSLPRKQIISNNLLDDYINNYSNNTKNSSILILKINDIYPCFINIVAENIYSLLESYSVYNVYDKLVFKFDSEKAKIEGKYFGYNIDNSTPAEFCSNLKSFINEIKKLNNLAKRIKVLANKLTNDVNNLFDDIVEYNKNNYVKYTTINSPVFEDNSCLVIENPTEIKGTPCSIKKEEYDPSYIILPESVRSELKFWLGIERLGNNDYNFTVYNKNKQITKTITPTINEGIVSRYLSATKESFYQSLNDNFNDLSFNAIDNILSECVISDNLKVLLEFVQSQENCIVRTSLCLI